MNILTVDNITKSYGVRKIFDGASFFPVSYTHLTLPTIA